MRKIFDLQTREEYNQSVENFYRSGLDAITEKYLDAYSWKKINDHPALTGVFFLAAKNGRPADMPLPSAICTLMSESLALAGIPVHVLEKNPRHGIPAVNIAMLRPLGVVGITLEIKKHFEESMFNLFTDILNNRAENPFFISEKSESYALMGEPLPPPANQWIN